MEDEGTESKDGEKDQMLQIEVQQENYESNADSVEKDNSKKHRGKTPSFGSTIFRTDQKGHHDDSENGKMNSEQTV